MDNDLSNDETDVLSLAKDFRSYSIPPSVSCQTIPSRVTEVPGSSGPKQSGSVIVPISVPTLAST